MKAILISIKPEWLEKILNGEKTIEIRKTMPKCELPIDVYIYCTNSLPKLMAYYGRYNTNYGGTVLNGKVLAKFTLNKINRFCTRDLFGGIRNGVYEITGSNIRADEIEDNGCVAWEELDKYSDGKNLYAWHIDDLKIFDKPMGLNELKIKKPPQSWQYIEV